MTPRFNSLRDWLNFCQQDSAASSASARQDPEHVDEIQAAVRALTLVLEQHEDAQRLANLWFTIYGRGRWRLVSVIGKRAPKEGVP